jgi:hypothetical protein
MKNLSKKESTLLNGGMDPNQLASLNDYIRRLVNHRSGEDNSPPGEA